jgi:hypothetical protein
MKKTNLKLELEAKIAFLKAKQESDFNNLRTQYFETIESIKPLNLIKSATKNFIETPNLKANLINGALGFGLNFISKKFANENSENPVKRVLGKALKFAIKNFIGKKSIAI